MSTLALAPARPKTATSRRSQASDDERTGPSRDRTVASEATFTGSADVRESHLTAPTAQSQPLDLAPGTHADSPRSRPARRMLRAVPPSPLSQLRGSVFGEIPDDASALVAPETVTPARRTYPPASAPMPRTSPKKTFDRVTFASPPMRCPYNSAAEWAAERVQLDRPLPDGVVPLDRFVASIVCQVIEVLCGNRPVRQLQTWFTPSVFEALDRRASLARRVCGAPERRPAPRVKRVRVQMAKPRAGEIAVVVHDGLRIRAAAVRAELRRGRWHVVALDIA